MSTQPAASHESPNGTHVAPSKLSATLLLVRSLFHLAAVVFVTLWGFLTHQLPFPGILWGLGALVAAILIWALFLSPRPVLHTDRFAQALLELVFLGAGVFAFYLIGGPIWLVIAFGIAGMVVSYVSLTARAKR